MDREISCREPPAVPERATEIPPEVRRGLLCGWARRTRELFAHLQNRFPWLLDLCDEFGTLTPRLLEAPRTVIHGEYFGLNIIYQNGTSWPADWQSAAIAPGEIDLASLTHSWPRPLVRKCEREYRRSRWPDGAPDDFPEILDAARAYMNFRWLGVLFQAEDGIRDYKVTGVQTCALPI